MSPSPPVSEAGSCASDARQTAGDLMSERTCLRCSYGRELSQQMMKTVSHLRSDQAPRRQRGARPIAFRDRYPSDRTSRSRDLRLRSREEPCHIPSAQSLRTQPETVLRTDHRSVSFSSIRRFWARASDVSSVLTGRYSPNPVAARRSGGNPSSSVMYLTTDNARPWLSSQLSANSPEPPSGTLSV